MAVPRKRVKTRRPAVSALVLMMIAAAALPTAAQDGPPSETPGNERTYRLDYDRPSATEQMLAPAPERPRLELKDLAKDPENIPSARRRGLRNYPERDEEPDPGLDVPSEAIPRLRDEQRRLEQARETLDRRLESTEQRGSTLRQSPLFPVGRERENAQARPRLERERRALEAEIQDLERDIDRFEYQQRLGREDAGATPLEMQLQRARERVR